MKDWSHKAAVAKNPHQINASRRIRRGMGESLMDNEAANVVDLLDKDHGGCRQAALLETQKALRRELGFLDKELKGYQRDLFEACLKTA